MGFIGSVWGVIDFLPETDFPDIRGFAYIHSALGAAIVIPREDDLVRIYVQQSPERSAALVNPQTGRVEMGRADPEEFMAQAKEILMPFHISAKGGKILWWTVYVGQYLHRC